MGGTPGAGVTSQELGELAARHGLRKVGVRPPLVTYVRETWRRRDFARYMATSSIYAENQNTFLGQLWTILNPALNALVYILIFGIVLKLSRGLENFIGFIVIGTFVYRFVSDSATGGARSISKNLNLVRSLHFPRAVLPVSAVMAQFASLVPTVGVMIFFVLISGIFPSVTFGGVDWEWLLLVPALVLTYLFCTGVALILARIVAALPDLDNILPFVLRVLMYASGVIFPIERYVPEPTLNLILQYQPVAIYLDLARQALLQEPTIPLDATKWLWGIGWAVLFFVVGFIFFWRAEARYGRE